MNFWHMQLHPNNQKWGREKELLQTLGIIGLGEWEEKGGQQEAFENKMQIGDVVAIKCASKLIALVEVTGDYEYTEETGELDWFVRRRKIKVLDWYQPEYNYYVSPRGTLTRCNPENDDAESNVSILSWYNTMSSKKSMNEIKEILLFKRQIILQGPPGTGKTRLAKMLAEELVKPSEIGDAMSIINNFFSSLDPTDELRKAEKEKRGQLLSSFQKLFPIDQLKDISLDAYCAGKGDRNNFCWWIETGLKSLGKYSPGSARSYLIYWSKEQNDYVKQEKLSREFSSDEEAIKKIGEMLNSIVKKKKPKDASNFFGDSYILKILNSYYPDEYFPINGRDSLDNALRLFGIDPSQLDTMEKNIRLNDAFKSKKKEFDSDVDSFEFMRFLFANFNLKTGEDIDKNQLVVSKGEYQLIQFHPAYSYEDFVRGIVASATEKGIEYRTENKIFADFAQKAKENPKSNYVLIIDEINRANLPSVLGELIYGLEYRGQSIAGMYELDNENEITIPENLLIIGTMNTADRSVGHIDYAIRRRFAFVNVLPDESVIIHDKGKELFKSIKQIFEEHLSPDFRLNDVLIGHSYFLGDKKEQIDLKFNYEVKPILWEYLKDGILLQSAKGSIDSLNV